METTSCPFAFLPERRRGFTLVELAIVLVIIGLIVGGVLMGQDLIRNAEYRSQVGMFQKIESATGAFRLKYNALPGDYTRATATWSTAGILNGDGNGQINSGFVQWSTFDTEIQQYWVHLAQAGMIELGPEIISGQGTIGIDFPKNPAANSGSVVVYSTYSAAAPGYYSVPNIPQMGNYLWMNIGVNISSGGSPTLGSASRRRWTSHAAAHLDEKLDDGKPVTGKLYAPTRWSNSVAQAAGSWSYNDFCRNATTNAYINLTNATPAPTVEVDTFACYLVYGPIF